MKLVSFLLENRGKCVSFCFIFAVLHDLGGERKGERGKEERSGEVVLYRQVRCNTESEGVSGLVSRRSRDTMDVHP